MADLHDYERELGIVDGVEDPIVPLAKTILFLPGEFLSARGTWFRGETPDPGGDALAICRR